MRTRLVAMGSIIWGAALVATGEGVKCPKPTGDFARPYIMAPQAPADAAYVPPRLKKLTRPKYPDAAFKNRIEGTVLLELLIDESGCVAATRVVESIPGLDEAAIGCVAKWRFIPASENGRPVATLARAPITFRRY